MSIATTYTPLASTTLSSTTNSITFSNIPNTYADLVFVVQVAGTSGNYLNVRLNGDAGSNYPDTFMYGSGSTVAAFNGTDNSKWLSMNLMSSQWANQVWHILDYAQTDKYKIAMTQADKGQELTSLSALKWNSLAAVNSVQFFLAQGGDMSIGTTISLYGVLG